MLCLDERLAARLRKETFIRGIESFAELPSTNDRALQLAAEPNQTLPLLVHTRDNRPAAVAARITGGRAPGAFTFSVSIDTAVLRLESQHWPLVSLATALGVRRAAAEFVPGAAIGLKWPNDVYAAGRKVCGILVETVTGRSNRLVIGVGLNVNNTFDDAPAEIRAVGVSLAELAGNALDATEILIRILANLHEEISGIGRESCGIAERWREHCLLRGRLVTVENGAGSTTGLCQSIDDSGGLLLETSDGPRRLYGGTVKAVAWPPS